MYFREVIGDVCLLEMKKKRKRKEADQGQTSFHTTVAERPASASPPPVPV
jgi:hypothetical protein